MFAVGVSRSRQAPVGGRVPFPDRHLDELVRSITVSQKIGGMTEKDVRYEDTRQRMSATMYAHHKRTFTIQPAAPESDERLLRQWRFTLPA